MGKCYYSIALGLLGELVVGIRQSLLLGYPCDDVTAAAMRLALRARDMATREAQASGVLQLTIEAAAGGSEVWTLRVRMCSAEFMTVHWWRMDNKDNFQR